MLGVGIVGLLILGLGLAGLLKPVPTLVLVLFVFAVTFRELSTLSLCISEVIRAARSTRERRAYTSILIGLGVLFAIEAASPPWMPDDSIYHLPATKAFVEHGRVYPLEDNSLGNMPFLIHMIYALCLMAKADIAPKLFSLLLTFTTAVSLYAFCARFLTRYTGLVAMIAFLAAAMVIEVGVTTRVDVSLAEMLFLTTYALMIYLDRGAKGWLYAAGLLGGFSLGIKLTSLAWLGLLCGMFFFESVLRRREKWAAGIRDLFIFISLIAVIASPWFIKNYVWFNNPVYPFRSGEVAGLDSGKPHYFNEADEKNIDGHLEAARKAAPYDVQKIDATLASDASRRPVRHPLRFWEYFTNPEPYFMGDFRHYPNYLFLLVPFYALMPKRKWLNWLLILSIGFFIFIAANSWIARFLLPLYPPLTLISAYTLVELRTRLRNFTALADRVPFYVVAACLLLPVIVSLDTILRMQMVPFLIGNKSRTQFLSKLDYYPAIRFINTKLPPQSKIMLVGVQMGYHIKPDYLSEESWDSTEWRRLLARAHSPQQISEELRRQGITHIFYSPSLFRFAARMGRKGSGGVEYMSERQGSLPPTVPDYISLRNWATFDVYAKDYLEVMYSDENGFTVYRVK